MDPLTIIAIVVVIFIAIAMIFWLGKRESVSTDILYSEALDAILKGDNTAAIKLLKQVVSKDSDNVGAYLQLGNIIRSTNPRQAAKIHQSLTVRPKLNKRFSKDIHQALAIDYIEIDNYKRAKIEAEMVLKNDKTNLWAHEFLLNIAEKLQNWDEAKSLAQKINKLTGKIDYRQLASIHLKAAKYSIENDDSKKAFQNLNKAVKLDPTFGEPYLLLANLYESEKNNKKAVLNWEKYLINSNNVDRLIYKKIESTLFDDNRFSEAEQIYTRIIKEKPDEKYALVKLINLLVDKDEVDQAEKLLDGIINNIPESDTARLLKIKLLLDKDNPSEIKSQIDELINN